MKRDPQIKKETKSLCRPFVKSHDQMTGCGSGTDDDVQRRLDLLRS